MRDRRDPARRGLRGAGYAVVAVVVVVVALVTAACSPAPSEAPPTTTAPIETPAVTPASTVGSPGPVVTPSPEPSPALTPAAALCTAADIKVSHGLVEGSAGARNTEVVLVAGIQCAVPAWPAFGIRDGRGGALIGGVSEGPGFVTLFPNSAYASEARLADWCGPEPAFPLTLELRLGEEAVEVTGGPFPDEGDMPPCSGGVGPMLTGTPWTPSS